MPPVKYRSLTEVTVEIAYVIEKRPTIAGINTSVPKPAIFVFSELEHLLSMFLSAPANQ
jgi:hypothetical protein